MKRKYIIGIAIVALLFIIFKLTDNKNITDEGLDDNGEVVNTTVDLSDKDVQPQDLILFVPSENKLTIEERYVTLSNTDNKSTVELLIDALKEDGKSDDSYIRPIPSDVIVNDVKLKDNTVTVDFKKSGLDKDAGTESILLDCLVLTMTTLKGVDQVQILVDGQKTSEFMGTFNIEKPLKIENVTNNVSYLEEDLKEKEDNNDKTEEEN